MKRKWRGLRAILFLTGNNSNTFPPTRGTLRHVVSY